MCFLVIMQDKGTFISPFPRPRCLAAAAPTGKAKLTHPGKAILAGKFITILSHGKVRVGPKGHRLCELQLKPKLNRTVSLFADTLWRLVSGAQRIKVGVHCTGLWSAGKLVAVKIKRQTTKSAWS